MKSKLAKNLLIIGGVTAGLYVVGGYLKSQGAAADATGYGQIGGEDDRASDAFGSPIYTTPSTTTDGYSYQDLLDAFNQGLAVSPTTDNVDSSGNMSYEDPNVINTLKANSNQDPYVSTPSAEPSLMSSLGDVGVIGGAFGANVLLDKSAKGAANAIDIKFPKYADDLAELTPWQKFLKDPYGLVPAKPLTGVATDVATKTTKSTISEVGAGVAISAIPKGWKIAKNVVNFIPLLDIPLGASIDMYLSKKYDPTDNQLNWADAFAANSAGELAQGGITAGGALVGGVGAVPAFIAGVTADVAATEAYYAARGYSSLFGDGRNSGTNPSGAVNMSYEDPAVIADLKKNTPNPLKKHF